MLKFLGILIIVILCIVVLTVAANINAMDWRRIVVPRFMRKRFKGQIIEKDFEEVVPQFRSYGGGRGGTRTRAATAKLTNGSYANYFVVVSADDKQLGFNLTKLQYDQIQERGWYEFSYYKGHVFWYKAIEKTTDKKDDPFEDYYKKESKKYKQKF